MSWKMVDEGWGRQAVDFATLSEPSNCREYVRMHHYLGVSEGHRLLDVACGSGLSIELAGIRGASCAGIDASPRLVAVATDRNPDADIRVGDMHDLPWDDETFDFVTSFRGIWATTPGVMQSIHRVLVPGGKVSMTVWGNVGKSPGAWTFAPFQWADEEKVEYQAKMVSLGRPGAGEAFLADAGFEPDERFIVPFVVEYADAETFARGMASVGPSYEAMQAIGEEEFMRRAIELAKPMEREGLPLRGLVELWGYVGTKR